MIVILTTTPTQAEGNDLAEKLVGEKLAACVQVLSPMTSFYFWESEVHRDEEFLLLIKTTSEKYDKVEKVILENHSYDVPEIVAIEAAQVSEKYETWLKGYLT